MLPKNRTWAALIICSTVVVLALTYLAFYRYAVAPVYPPLPQPDYTLQVAICYLGCGAVLAACITTGVLAHKGNRNPNMSTRNGCFIIVALGIITALAALIIPAP